MATPGSTHLKVILTGQYGVGKSSLFRRFVNDSFQEETTVTSTSDGTFLTLTSTLPAPDNHRRQFMTDTGRKVELKLWDTAGMERFCTMSGNYYANASAVIVVYSLDDPNSLSTAVDCILEAITEAGRLSSLIGGLVVFLCGNKSDLADVGERGARGVSRVVSVEAVDKLTEQFDQVVQKSFVVSCKSGQGVQEMFQDVAEILDELVREKAERRTKAVAAAMGNSLSIRDADNNNVKSARDGETTCAC
jgi:Ras-related protein Rab-35